MITEEPPVCGKPVRDWEGVLRFCHRPPGHNNGCNPFSDTDPQEVAERGGH